MRIQLRPATPADRPALLDLFRAAFEASADAADWAWKYDANPNPGVSALALLGDRIVGFYGGFGTRYRGAEGNLPGVSAVDVMTHPDARALSHRTLFSELGEAYCRFNLEAGVPFYFGFPHERHRVLGERLLGYRSAGPAGEWTRPHSAPPLLGRLRRRLLRVSTGDALSPAHAALAETLHARPGWRTDRSLETLSWRLARPGARYRVHELNDARGRSSGYAVVRTVGERALAVDLQLADEESAALADLVDAVSEVERGRGTTCLVVRAPREARLGARLLDMGFSRAASDTHFEVRPLDPAFDLARAAPAFDYRFLDHDIF